MRRLLTLAPVLAALASAAFVVAPAQAHRQWMLPSATVLSGENVWVTVDAAVSNDLFYFEHVPMRLEGIVATAPDGTPAKIENGATGKYRSVFDVQLTQKGTYKIASVNDGVFAGYKLNGEQKRWRGKAEEFASAIPAGATDVNVSQVAGRNEIYVTNGAPTETVRKATGRGLELVSGTHPNDLVSGEEATFGFALDGKPAANIEVTVVPGGIRYRDQLNEMKLKTDAEGNLKVTWPEAGMYWLEAEFSDDKTSVPQAKQRRVSYVTTLEVLAP